MTQKFIGSALIAVALGIWISSKIRCEALGGCIFDSFRFWLGILLIIGGLLIIFFKKKEKPGG